MLRKLKRLLPAALAALATWTAMSCATDGTPADSLLFIGSYAPADSAGIALYRFDPRSGDATFLRGFKGVPDPSFQTMTRDGRLLYSVGEGKDDTAQLVAYRFDRDALELHELNRQKTGGAWPCHVWVDSRQRVAVTANYGGGSVSVFALNGDGSLQPARVTAFEGGTPGSERQSQPHLHFVYASPDGRYVYANDLGTDRIRQFDLTEREGQAALEERTPDSQPLPEGEGPRHSVFHPNGRWVYVIGELSGRVTQLHYDNGTLTPGRAVQADTLHAAGSADIHITPDGRFLYASNRLQGDGIAVFAIDSRDGHLTKAGYQPTGIHPRNFAITPDGRFLLCACRDSHCVQVFAIDPATGLLHDTGKTIQTPSPVCLTFVP